VSRLRAQSLRLPAARGAQRAKPGTRAVVIGGGIAGVAAAAVLCERGVHVTLLEREAELGGRAGSFPYALDDGAQVQMERGFHAFFRQYYNLRALLARVDPELRMLLPVDEYPILAPGSVRQTFRDGRGLPALRVLKTAWRTPHLRVLDLPHIDGRRALEMLRFDPERTYADYDGVSADAYLTSLGFPPDARRVLFDVFAHSFFNPEREMSAAELLMMFHCYFTGNPEGIVFDVMRAPTGVALWRPFRRWLVERSVEVKTGVAAERVVPRAGGGYVVEHAEGHAACDLLVLALDVSGLRRLLANGPTLDPDLSRKAARLSVTNPFAVLRLWLDRPLAPERAVFAGTTASGELDSIARYDRFQDESAAWAARSGGAVVELHGYALRLPLDEAAVRADLLAGMHAHYPETRGARVVSECFLLRDDCPAFPPSGHAERPTPETALPDVALAGDFVRMPFPCALMERAAASGLLAANLLLAPLGVAPEPIDSVPSRGLFAPIHTPRSHGIGATLAR
jgi:isorenieratene synthase